jgi:GNAT superfamily N-acetyltransferase
MFCSPDLAARIDRAEGRLCSAMAEGILARQSDADTLLLPVGGGVAIFSGPDSPSNKMIGLGFDGPVDTQQLEHVESQFTARSARLQAEVSTLADPSLHGLLCSRGYVPSGFENVLGHPLSTNVQPAPDHVSVIPATPAEFETFADVIIDAFAHPDTGGVGGDATPPSEELRRWILLTLSLPGFRPYLAHIDGQVAGAASMRIDDRIAQFSGAGTLPTFRRRGVQTALLRARLAFAASAGCDLAVIVTQPASKSQQNSQREGFSLLCARQLLVKAHPSAQSAAEGAAV